MEEKFNFKALFKKDTSLSKDTFIEGNPAIQRASLMNTFDLNEDFIKKGAAEQEINLLKENSFQTRDNSFVLKEDTRKKVLNYLIKENKINKELEEVNNEVTRSMASYLDKNQKAPALSQQGEQELVTTFKVSRWLGGLVDGIPTADEVKYELNKREFLAPLKRLTSNFLGREAELSRIKDYVDWLPKETFTQKAASGIRALFSWHKKKPLLITGIGGVGKSTLISKFILDHSIEQQKGKLPFVYIDFDITGFSISEPLNIVVEGLRQIGFQFPRQKPLYDQIIKSITDALNSETEDNYSNSSTQTVRSLIQTNVEGLIAQYASDINYLDSPILVVFDSFEELQYRASSHDYDNFFSTIREISEMIPKIRPVFVGRGEIEYQNIEFEKIHLSAFDKNSASGYLASRGVTDKDLRLQIFEKFGGHPLTLQLAASLAKKENLEAGSGLTDITTMGFFAKLEEGRVQEELVKRNMDHIEDDEVRKIAVPGLILRKIDPEVIQHVLAQPSGLGKLSKEKAVEIFGKLEKETFLIQSSDYSDALVFRQDLRMALEGLVKKSYPEAYHAIRDRAIEFYEARTEKEDVAELVYHKLKRGDDPGFFTNDLFVSIRKLIENSIRELPIAAQIYIGELMGTTLSLNILEAAKIEEWERYYTKLIRDAFKSDLPTLKRLERELARRKERTFNSSLNYYEAWLHQRLGNLDRSIQIINDNLKELTESRYSDNPKYQVRQLKLQLLLAENFEYKRDFSSALNCLQNIQISNIDKAENPGSIIRYCFLLKRISERLYEGVAPEEESLRLMQSWKAIKGVQTAENEEYKLSMFYLRNTDLLENWNNFRFLPLKEFEHRYKAFRKQFKNPQNLESFVHKTLDLYLKDLSEAGAQFIITMDAYNALEAKAIEF